MDQPDPKAVNDHVMRLGDDPAPNSALIEPTEPFVVIAGHDRQRAPPMAELGQVREARVGGQLVFGEPGAHPEIAEVADDHQVVRRREPAEPGAEAAVAFGMVPAQVDIAGEVMRHGQQIPIVSSPSSRSRSNSPARTGVLPGLAVLQGMALRLDPMATCATPLGWNDRRPAVIQRLGWAGLCCAAWTATCRRAEGGPGRLDRQIGPVALLAQVEQDQMPHGSASRSRQDGLDQRGPWRFERWPWSPRFAQSRPSNGRMPSAWPRRD